MTFKSFFIWVLAIYLLLCASFSIFQNLFFLHPKALDSDYKFSFDMPFEERQILLDKNTSIDILMFKPKDSVPKGVVLYLHGNQENVERYAPYSKNFTKHGYECWMPDYPTYGKSTGAITVANMENMALQLYKMAKAKYATDKIIVYGKSMGTGLAAYLASVSDCKQLILETPYYSLQSLSMRYTPFIPINMFLKMEFTTGEYIKRVMEPVTIFHGVQDEVIPFSNGMRLISNMKKGDRFVAIPDGEHNNLPSKLLYQNTLDSLLSTP